MDAWGLPLSLAALCVVCFILGLCSAESRPGFARDSRIDRKERWFFHSKID
jgi:hypothetical protein